VIYGWNVTGQVGLYRSTDEGNTWQLVNTPSLAATGVFALAAHPTDPDQLWAATATGLMHSSDAAASWQQATNRAPVTTVTVDPSAPDRLLAYAAQPGDGLLESSDGGQTWTPIGWRLAAAGDAVIHLAVDPDDPQQLYAATAGQDLLHSRDGGSSWQHLARAGVPTT
jgi:photosystem II stability/assembly factor-like uncharacterized protein